MMPLRPALLVALATAVLAEVMRVSFPLLYDLAGGIGFATAAWVVPLVFAAPLLTGIVGRWVGPGAMMAAGVGGLAVARVVLQVQSSPTLVVALAGTLTGLVGLTVALRRAAVAIGGAGASSALFLGLAVDAAIRVGLTTWDAAWQSTPFAWLVGLALPAALLAMVIVDLRAADDQPGADSLSYAVLPGPVLALQTLFLANPAFVASSGRIDLPVAGAIVLVGLAAAAVMPVVQGLNAWTARIWLVVAAVALTGPTGATGPAVWIGVPLGQACLGALVVTACTGWARGAPAERTVWTGVGAGLGSLTLVGVLLPYQISYELSLGVPQFAFVALGAAMLVAIAWPPPDSEPPGPSSGPPADAMAVRRAAVLAPMVGLLVPLWSALSWPEPSSSDTGRMRVATYNIHSAISWEGRLDPETIAQVIEDGGAEIVMLQEVARGWPLAGGLDASAWLSRRLGADIAYGTAADHQFGNAVLSTYPIVRQWSGVMDRGDGTMQRGYVGAAVLLGDTTVDVWSTHLQHQDHTTATRQAQARQVLGAWREIGQPERTILGGDLNSRPDSPDVEPWFDGTDLVSAQDVAGDPGWNTSPALRPDHRIDWIFGTPDLVFSDVAVPQTLASDHLPVFATVDVPAGDADG